MLSDGQRVGEDAARNPRDHLLEAADVALSTRSIARETGEHVNRGSTISRHGWGADSGGFRGVRRYRR
jgi:hypothetical protein